MPIPRAIYLCQVGRRPPKLFMLGLGTPRPGTECSRALRARNPKRVRKESERVPQGLRPRGAPESPKSAPRSPTRVQKRRFGPFLDSFRAPWRTLRGLWGSGPGAPFRTLLGFWARRAREHSVPGRGVPNVRPVFLFLPFSLFCLQMAKICCFCLAKSQKRRQKTRPPPYLCQVGRRPPKLFMLGQLAIPKKTLAIKGEA